jgi:tetratricopeptide (TPR) repeat protein
MRKGRFCLALAVVMSVGMVAPKAADFSSAGAPDLSRARELIAAKDYKAALANLSGYESSQHPDVFSLMGYSYRKSGDRPRAFEYYAKALAGNPDHRGALEYQGELYIEVGQIDKAKANLVHLKRLCPTGCEELDDLEDALKGK